MPIICPNCGTVTDTILYTSGSMHFDGEPWDDYEDHELCAGCGAECLVIPEPAPEITEIPF